MRVALMVIGSLGSVWISVAIIDRPQAAPAAIIVTLVALALVAGTAKK